jgi:lysozyme
MPSRREAAITRSVIDVSHWEYPIDFKKVAADGIVAVIAKATQGAGGIDATYASYKEAAAAYKLLWGSYHFGTGSEVDVQVEHYLSTTKPNDFELICLDFEPNPNGPTMTLDQAREFVVLLQDRTGRYPVLYGGYWLKKVLTAKSMISLPNVRFGLRNTGQNPFCLLAGRNTPSGNTPTVTMVPRPTPFPVSAAAIEANSAARSLNCASSGRLRGGLQ